VEVVKHNLIKHLVHLITLLQDDGSFFLDGRGFELRFGQQVTQDIHVLLQVVCQALGVVDSILSGGVGIDLGAQILNLEL